MQKVAAHNQVIAIAFATIQSLLEETRDLFQQSAVALPVAASSTGRLVILGVTESDAHVVANQLIAYQLRADGFTVVNLGACTPLEDFIDAFRRYPSAEALIIGSLNGHAYEDLRGLKGAKDNLLITCPVIVGGNLGVTRDQRERMRTELLLAGVDFVLESPEDLLAALNRLPRRNSSALDLAS